MRNEISILEVLEKQVGVAGVHNSESIPITTQRSTLESAGGSTSESLNIHCMFFVVCVLAMFK